MSLLNKYEDLGNAEAANVDDNEGAGDFHAVRQDKYFRSTTTVRRPTIERRRGQIRTGHHQGN